MDLFGQTEPVLRNRDLYDRPGPIPVSRIQDLTPDLSSVRKRDSNDAQQSSSGMATTPIVIGVIVPILIIVIILLVIWRRRRKIVKTEKANDKYKSLDFGIDESGNPSKGRKRKLQKAAPTPEMSIADVRNTLRTDKGLSLDLDSTNPFILPPEVQHSRESLRSLSRSINTGDDKYRATTFVPDDGSIRSPSSMRSHGDNSSIWTGSTQHRSGTMGTESRIDLLPRAPTSRDHSETPSTRNPLSVAERHQSGLLTPIPQEHVRNSTLSTNSHNANVTALRASNNYLGAFISGGQKKEPAKKEQPGQTVSETEVQVAPPVDRLRELPAAVIRDQRPDAKRSSPVFDSKQPRVVADLTNSNTDTKFSAHQQATIPQTEALPDEADIQSQFPQPTHSQLATNHLNQEAHDANSQQPTIPQIKVQENKHQQIHDHDDDGSDYYDDEVLEGYEDHVDNTHRGSMMGQRPLPPDDPSENPEQRANRIRSFYKEYFEDTGKNPPAARPTDYYDGSEQYDDFDYGYYEQPHTRGPSVLSDGRHRAFSHGNHGYYPPGGPRAQSSMSGRMGPRQVSRPPPKKKLPPPKPLMVLPTPSKMGSADDFLPNAIDYAPPRAFKNQRSGTPDSLEGGLRPYSPSVRAHVPLTSSFDDLTVMPSPHSLRKSGTFTGLDFAPPRRFKENGESTSETGSIRSNRSNVSQMHLANIRSGAYRVSRIPKGVAGTRDDMFTALKPQWDMRGDSAVVTGR